MPGPLSRPSSLATAVALFGTVLVGALGLSAGPAAADSRTFNYTGGAQGWTVPTGVALVHVVVAGAQGADSWNPGGLGGVTQADLLVTPGETLTIYVGGAGSGINGGVNGGGRGTPVRGRGAPTPGGGGGRA